MARQGIYHAPVRRLDRRDDNFSLAAAGFLALQREVLYLHLPLLGMLLGIEGPEQRLELPDPFAATTQCIVSVRFLGLREGAKEGSGPHLTSAR